MIEREEILRMAEQAGIKGPAAARQGFKMYASPDRLRRFAELVAAAERKKAAQWMMQEGYATGHGDSIEDLLKELEWQVQEREREACAKMVEDMIRYIDGYECVDAIRARATQVKSHDDWRPTPDLA